MALVWNDCSWQALIKPCKRGLATSNFWAWWSLCLPQSCILWCHHFLRRTSPVSQLFVFFHVMLWYIKLCPPAASHSVLSEVDLSVWINKPCFYYVYTQTWLKRKDSLFVFLVFSVYFWLRTCFTEVIVFSDNEVWHSTFFGVIWTLRFEGQVDDNPQNSCINGFFRKIPAWMFGSLYWGIVSMFSKSNYLEFFFPYLVLKQLPIKSWTCISGHNIGEST